MTRSAILVVLAMLVASGCGWHLRTWDLSSSVSSVHVDGSSGNPASAPLKRNLRQAGVQLANVADEAEVVVTLLDQRRERRSVAVTDQARAAEYETSLAIQYAITGAEGVELVPPRWVQASRVYRVDRTNIVGSSEEQALLEREMVSDLVQQIIRALDVATREDTVAVQT